MKNRCVARLLTLFVFATASAVALPQTNWIRQSAIPIDRTPKGVFALSPDHAFFVGENQFILETNSKGTTWNLHTVSDWGTDPYYAIGFASPNIGIILTNNGALRTTNGGATWTPVADFFPGSWYHVDFVSSTTGFAGANGGLAKTTDAGATWTLMSSYPDCPVIYGMDFRDSNVGLVTGEVVPTSESGIFKTSNGGQTWVRKSTGTANDIIWMSSTRAIADLGTTMRESIDSGETWHQISSGITTGLINLQRLGNSNGAVGVSTKGDVWRSTDGGFTWLQTFDGPGALPEEWNIHFSDELHGWIVGPGGFFYYSEDGGQTWQQKNTGCTAQVEDIHMLDANYGLAVGYNGYVFRTQNGGDFWDVQKLEVTGQIFGRDEGLAAVDVVDRDFAAAAGPGGTVFKTENGGQTWTSIGFPNLPNLFYIYDVDFVDHNVGYVYGIDQDLGHTKTLYRTTNGGATWTWMSLGERGGGTTVQFVDAQHGWLTADNAFGLRTVDGGANWTPINLPTYFSGPEVSNVRFLNQNEGWAAGWDGYLAKTLNGGTTWNLINLGTIEDHLFDVVPVSSTEIWACGRESWSFAGVMYHSTNGGQSWTRQVVTDWFYYPYRMTALATGEAWFGGYAGAIFGLERALFTVQPTSMFFKPGVEESGNLTSAIQSDNQYVIARSNVLGSRSTDSMVMHLTGTSPSAAPSSIQFTLESHVDANNMQVTIELWNFSLLRWEAVSTSIATRTDSTLTVAAGLPASRFVHPTTRELRAQIRWRPTRTVISKVRSYVDLARWTIEP